MITITLILVSLSCGYVFPESPFLYDYDLKVVEGIVAFANPNNVQLEYHFGGYGNNVLEMYGNGTVEIYKRGVLFDRVEVPEPMSLFIWIGVLCFARLSKDSRILYAGFQ